MQDAPPTSLIRMGAITIVAFFGSFLISQEITLRILGVQTKLVQSEKYQQQDRMVKSNE